MSSFIGLHALSAKLRGKQDLLNAGFAGGVVEGARALRRTRSPAEFIPAALFGGSTAMMFLFVAGMEDEDF